jgi:hypothetical protein
MDTQGHRLPGYRRQEGDEWYDEVTDDWYPIHDDTVGMWVRHGEKIRPGKKEAMAA